MFLELYFPAIEITNASNVRRQNGKYTIGG
jgi:hypothetical protein